jgi:hypothetical protein
MAKPGDSDTLADLQLFDARADGVDAADDLVPGNDRELRIGKFSVNDMQIRATNPTGKHLHPYFIATWLRVRELSPLQRRFKSPEYHRLHLKPSTEEPLYAGSRSVPLH